MPPANFNTFLQCYLHLKQSSVDRLLFIATVKYYQANLNTITFKLIVKCTNHNNRLATLINRKINKNNVNYHLCS